MFPQKSNENRHKASEVVTDSDRRGMAKQLHAADTFADGLAAHIRRYPVQVAIESATAPAAWEAAPVQPTPIQPALAPAPQPEALYLNLEDIRNKVNLEASRNA